MNLTTQQKKKMQAKHKSIYNEYCKLIEKGSMKGPTLVYLGEKYGYSQWNIRAIIKKLKQELK